METLLFGTLAYAGYKMSSKQKNIKEKYQETDSIDYQSTNKEKVDNLEKARANKMKNLKVKKNDENMSYLKQFDKMSLNNTGEPSAYNDTNNTRSGIDCRLQRDLEFKQGYSKFQQEDMHYNVTPREHFVHNNMAPHTRRRDVSLDLNRGNRQLEAFNGESKYDISKSIRKDPLPLFEPMRDLTYVNGIPSFTNKLKSRYIPSNKKNNEDIPFEHNIYVAPGVNGQNQSGIKGGGVYRIKPKTIDELRANNDQKLEGKPIMKYSLKRGERRTVNPHITTWKKPDFMEKTTDDLLPTKSNFQKQKQTGQFQDPRTNRSYSVYHHGPATNTSIGQGPCKDQSHWYKSNKEIYPSDAITRHVSNVTNKPVLQNKKAYVNYETQRSSTNQNIPGILSSTNRGNYACNPNDIAKTTIKETTIYNNNILGNKNVNEGFYVISKDFVVPPTQRNTYEQNQHTGSMDPYQRQTYCFNKNDIPKQTIRETTSMDTRAGNIFDNNMGRYVNNNDQAKQTVKETTSFNKYIGNTKSYVGGGYTKDKQMNAKQTIRETTSVMNANTNIAPIVNSSYSNYSDIAKPTIRETTEQFTPISNLRSQVDKSVAVDYNNTARNTIRQTTENNKFIGHATGDSLSYTRNPNEVAKPTIKQTTICNTPAVNIKSQNNKSYSRDERDVAKNTVRQTTLSRTPGMNLYDNSMGHYVIDKNDKAKVTIKQTTLLKNRTGALSSSVDKHRSYDAEYNMEIDDRREILTYNRTPGPRSDLGHPKINRLTVRLAEPSFLNRKSVRNCHLDMNRGVIVPRMTRSKPIVSQNNLENYRINSNFINTLQNNPLVNDPMHQKEINSRNSY